MASANEFKGHEATVATNSLGGTTIGKVRAFSLSVNNNLESSYVAGSRTVDSIKEGNLELNGSITLALRDKTEVLDLVTADPVAADMLYVRLDDDVTGNETVDLTLGNLKWGEWSFEFDNSGSTVEETATFIVTSLTVAEVTN